MNKLKFRVLIASVMIPCNLYSGPVFSMNDGQLNLIKKDQNQIIETNIPNMTDLLPVLKLFCKNVYCQVNRYTSKLSMINDPSNDELNLEKLTAKNACIAENELMNLSGENCDWGFCPDYMQNYQNGISLIDYINQMSRVFNEKDEGICRNLASCLYMMLHNKGIFCGVMFCELGINKSKYPKPNHVVILLAVKDEDNVKFFVADPRLVQCSFFDSYRCTKGIFFDYISSTRHEISQYSGSFAWLNTAKSKYMIQDLPISPYGPLDLLLIPLDKYLKWNHIFQESTSVEFDLNATLDLSKKDRGYGTEKNWPLKIGTKTIDDFKMKAKKIANSTKGKPISKTLHYEILEFWPGAK